MMELLSIAEKVSTFFAFRRAMAIFQLFLGIVKTRMRILCRSQAVIEEEWHK
jgi:hypothetical protein